MSASSPLRSKVLPTVRLASGRPTRRDRSRTPFAASLGVTPAAPRQALNKS